MTVDDNGHRLSKGRPFRMDIAARRTAIICDEQSSWLDAVDGVLHRSEFRLVGKTTSTGQALRLVLAEQPDLLVTELRPQNGDIDSLTLIRRSLEAVRSLRTVVLSAREDPRSIDMAMRAGAAAYVMKSAHPDDLAAAVRQVFGPSLFLADSWTPAHAPPREEPPTETWGLTRRELEILGLVAEGLSNAQVARTLWVTEQTVKFHLSNTYRKLGVSNRTEASRWAQLHGLLGRVWTAA
jgi:DNA-binding NarL/FixJ family response regulator